MRPSCIDLGQIDRHDKDFLLFDAGASKYLTGGSRHKALAPEFDTIAGQFFVTNSIWRSHVTAVGNGMRALDRFTESRRLAEP